MSTLLARLRSFVAALTGRDRFEDTLSEELRFHLQAYADDLTARGLSRREARRRARLHFGGVERVRDECRHARGLRSLDELFHDLRVGARVLLKTPLFSGSAILTIALATGLAMLTFTVVYGAVLRPLPFARGDRVVAIGSDPEFEALGLRDFRDRARSFTQVAGYARRLVTLVRPGMAPESVRAAAVSAGALDLLGVPPLMGRAFATGEDFRVNIRHVVIGERLWRTGFDATTDIVGSTLIIDGRSLEVVGVMRERFRFPFDEDLWFPMDFEMPTDDDPGSGRSFSVVGRLRDGVTLAEADAEARVILSQARDGGADASLLAAQVFPFGDLFLPPGFSALLLVALIAAGRVLVVACANVANLLLVRTLARQTEMAVRAALGAGRGRIARQCVVESLLLAVPGTAVGLWLAALGVGYFGGFDRASVCPTGRSFVLTHPCGWSPVA